MAGKTYDFEFSSFFLHSIVSQTLYFVCFFFLIVRLFYFSLVILLIHSLVLNIFLPLLQIPLKLSRQGILQPEKPIVLKVVPRDAVITGA